MKPNHILQRSMGLRGAAVLVTASASLFLGGLAFGADLSRRVSLDIAAQPLAVALLKLGEQTGFQVTMASSTVAGLSAPAVHGQYNTNEALGLLLSGTGLSYRIVDEHTIAIHRGEAAATRAGNGQESSTSSNRSMQLAYAADAAPAPAGANSGTEATEHGALEEVVVTAQKRQENLQVVPIAITALSGAELTRKNITSFEGVARATPSISFVPFPSSSNTYILYIRAQGLPNPQPVNSEGAVGMYEDGFFIARPQAISFDLADIDRVEILRGPQGTLYGRNTTGGAVNLISKAPTGEFGLKETVDFGNRDMYRTVTAINLPKLGDFSAKVTVLKSGIDGWVKNSGPSQDYGEEYQRAGRLQLRWEPSAIFRADYFADKGDLDSTPIYYQNCAFAGRTIMGYPYTQACSPRDTTYRPVNLPLSTASYMSHGLTLTWDVSDALTIKSLTGYREVAANYYQDYAESYFAAPGVVLPYATEDLLHSHQVSQELQFIGNALDNDITYVGGLYYFKEGGWNTAIINISSFNSHTLTRMDADGTSKAVYGQLTWKPEILQGRLEITPGARYTVDTREAERFTTANGIVTEHGAASGAVGNAKFNKTNPSFVVNYHWTGDISTYAKVATGYRAGGFYFSAPVGDFAESKFEPENVTSYEVGLKADWLEHRMRTNLAVFDSPYKNMQVTYRNNPANPAASLLVNAGTATIKGAELEVLVNPLDDLTLSINYAYLDARISKVAVLPGSFFDHAVNPGSPYRVGDNIEGLFAMPRAPKNSFDVATDYDFLHLDDKTFSAHLDYRWTGAEYQNASVGGAFANQQYGVVPSFGYLNGRLTMSMGLPHGDRAKVSLWSNNITDKRYVETQVTFNKGAFGSNGGFYGQATSWAEPRTFGVELGYEF